VVILTCSGATKLEGDCRGDERSGRSISEFVRRLFSFAGELWKLSPESNSRSLL